MPCCIDAAIDAAHAGAVASASVAPIAAPCNGPFASASAATFDGLLAVLRDAALGASIVPTIQKHISCEHKCSSA